MRREPTESSVIPALPALSWAVSLVNTDANRFGGKAPGQALVRAFLEELPGSQLITLPLQATAAEEHPFFSFDVGNLSTLGADVRSLEISALIDFKGGCHESFSSVQNV